MPPVFDVFFYHVHESYAQANLAHLRQLLPSVKVVLGLDGVTAVFQKMADLSNTTHFFTVDADNWVNPTFQWSVPGFIADDPRIHVWRCHNPMTELTYGHGAIKLWPKKMFADKPTPSGLDLTCSLAQDGFVKQREVASSLRYFDSPEEVWRQAFKECFKIASESNLYANTLQDPDKMSHLHAWLTRDPDRQFGAYSMHGGRWGTLLGHSACGKSLEQKRALLKEGTSRFTHIQNIERELQELAHDLRAIGHLTAPNDISPS